MIGDALASGQRSATFSAGQSEKGAPIEFHGTVATECEHGVSRENVCVLCKASEAAILAAVEKPALKSLEELAALYEPCNDRVLLRRVTEEDERMVQIAEQFKLESDLGIVIAVGAGMFANGQWIPIPYQLGDKVRVGHYNVEDIEIEGETLMLVSAYDIRLKIKA